MSDQYDCFSLFFMKLVKNIHDHMTGLVYEMELGTAGMMRGYMARRCDPYFTLERKIRRYLSMSLSALQVPAQEREQVIAFVAEIDMLAEARKVVDAVLASLSVQFDLKG